MQKKELGQVWTPTAIADEMAHLLWKYTPNKKNALIIDPCSGPGTFAFALNKIPNFNYALSMYEIDKDLAKKSKTQLKKSETPGRVIFADFLTSEIPENTFDACIINPPYIRHELIDLADKDFYSDEVRRLVKFDVPKRSNLYVYFLFKAISLLIPGGILAAIIYDTLESTQYGKSAWEQIRSHMEVLESKKISAPFGKVMVDAHILILRKSPSTEKKKDIPKQSAETNLVKISNLLTCKRGTAFSPRASYLERLQGQNRGDGVVVRSSALHAVNAKPTHSLKKLPMIGTDLWEPDGKGIIFNYYLRTFPKFFYVANGERVSDNFICITSSTVPKEVCWLLLNSTPFKKRIYNAARAQGSGLRKLQVYTFRDVLVPDWNLASRKEVMLINKLAKELLSANVNIAEVQGKIDYLLGEMGKNATKFTKAL